MTDIVGMVSPAVSSIVTVLNNPYFYAIVIALLILTLVPWTDD